MPFIDNPPESGVQRSNAPFTDKHILLSFFDYLCNSPILVLGKLSRFYYPDFIAYAAFVILVVSFEFGGLGYSLFIEGVLALFGD